MIVRKHRLWEVFLVEKLGFAWDEVHDIAEELEHIKSETLICSRSVITAIYIQLHFIL